MSLSNLHATVVLYSFHGAYSGLSGWTIAPDAHFGAYSGLEFITLPIGSVKLCHFLACHHHRLIKDVENDQNQLKTSAISSSGEQQLHC